MSTTSRLLNLSPELRNLIYEYALTSPTALDFTSPEPALARTCRKLREESLLLYYTLNTFILTIPPDQSAPLAACLTSLDREKIRSIPHLEIEYHLSSTENQPAEPQLVRRGAWVVLAKVLAGMGMRREQVSWRVVSRALDDPGVGCNYFVYLAERARLRVWQELIVTDWERIVDLCGREDRQAADVRVVDSEAACEHAVLGCFCVCCASEEWNSYQIDSRPLVESIA